ncbi:MAG: WYL domain-containing protein [Planctomycetaceae bacterium]|nr:WYL domain-containing protein [Planctomycetaceae bacterium]
MARNEQLIRQHKLLQILERFRFGRTLPELRDELVEELGLSSLHTRSVRRDLEALQAAGIDVGVHETQRGRVWKLGPLFRGSHKITASATELLAFSLGRDLLTPLAGTPFWIGIESFWNKIRDSLPASVWSHYEKYRQVLHVLGMPAKSYEKHQGMLKTINRSILEHRVVEINYKPLGQDRASKRQIHPYGIAFYHGSLYVIADACDADDADQPIRHLKLDRFRKATALDDWFKPRSDFHLEQHLRESIGIFSGGKLRTFRIQVSAYAAPWIEEDPWHPEQKIKRQTDGSIILTVKAGHDLEIIPRVLALGSEAELLSPASSRNSLKETVSRMNRTYRA